MVVGKIVSEGIKIGAKLSKYDDKAWKALYFGVRKDISLGIKHGAGLGSVIGTFINDDSSPFDGGTIPQQRSSFKTNKFGQKYNRRNISRRRRCNCHKRAYRQWRK